MVWAVLITQTPGSRLSITTVRPANSLPNEICPLAPTRLTLFMLPWLSCLHAERLSGRQFISGLPRVGNPQLVAPGSCCSKPFKARWMRPWPRSPGPGDPPGNGLELALHRSSGASGRWLEAECRGAIQWDTSKPDGTPKKQLDVSRLAALGWGARIPMAQGVVSTVIEFREQLSQQLVRL